MLISEYHVLRVTQGVYYIGTLYYNEQSQRWCAYEKVSKEFYDSYSDAYQALRNRSFTYDIIKKDRSEISLTPKLLRMIEQDASA